MAKTKKPIKSLLNTDDYHEVQQKSTFLAQYFAKKTKSEFLLEKGNISIHFCFLNTTIMLYSSGASAWEYYLKNPQLLELFLNKVIFSKFSLISKANFSFAFLGANNYDDLINNMIKKKDVTGIQ